jgi:hypothetical protein
VGNWAGKNAMEFEPREDEADLNQEKPNGIQDQKS